MPRITIKCQEEIEKARTLLANMPGKLEVAYKNAINASVYGTRDDMVLISREDYNYKVDAVRKRMWLSMASVSKLTGKVESKGTPVHLTDMLETKEVKPYGTWVNVKKSTGPRQIKHAFIAKGRSSGKAIVFIRGLTSEDYKSPTHRAQLQESITAGHVNPEGRVWRKPMLAMYAPHPEIVWNQEDNYKKLQEWADERMKLEFGNEIDNALEGWEN